MNIYLAPGGRIMQKKMMLLAAGVSFILIMQGVALANKSSVAIEAPRVAQKGSEIVVRITVTHKGNSALHYTNWLRVVINKKEVARWDFDSTQRPESEIFTRELKVKVMEDLEITAEANCILHGSAGPTTIKILINN